MAIQINGNGTITGISVGGLPDGIVDTDMLAANAVATAKIADSAVATAKIADSAVTATKATGIGITEADQWRYNQDVTMGQYAANLVTGWERNDTEFEKIGTGMTVNTSTGQSNSGHWTFPSTGKWLILVQWQAERGSGNISYGYHYIFAMNDGVQSNGFELANSGCNCGRDSARQTAFMQAIFDVTNTSTHRVLFGHYDPGVHNTTYRGHTGRNENAYTFIKLGET